MGLPAYMHCTTLLVLYVQGFRRQDLLGLNTLVNVVYQKLHILLVICICKVYSVNHIIAKLMKRSFACKTKLEADFHA